MKLGVCKVTLASGDKLISGYRVMLTKSEIEKAGFKAGDELKVTYKKNKIILEKKIEPSN